MFNSSGVLVWLMTVSAFIVFAVVVVASSRTDLDNDVVDVTSSSALDVVEINK